MQLITRNFCELQRIAGSTGSTGSTTGKHDGFMLPNKPNLGSAAQHMSIACAAVLPKELAQACQLAKNYELIGFCLAVRTLGISQSDLTPEMHAGWYIRHEQSHRPMGKCRKHQLGAAALNLTPRRDSRRIARAREVDAREYNPTDGTDVFSRHYAQTVMVAV